MISEQMMDELTGKAAQEQQAQRQANKERVIVEAIGRGEKYVMDGAADPWKRIDKTPEEIRNDIEGLASWADEMEEFRIDWLDIPDYETYRHSMQQLFDLTEFHEEVGDPPYRLYWLRLRRKHPDCPIIAALADFDLKWDDVAALPAVEGENADTMLICYPNSCDGFETDNFEWWKELKAELAFSHDCLHDRASLPAVEGDPDDLAVEGEIDVVVANDGVDADEDDEWYWEFDKCTETGIEMAEANGGTFPYEDDWDNDDHTSDPATCIEEYAFYRNLENYAICP